MAYVYVLYQLHQLLCLIFLRPPIPSIHFTFIVLPQRYIGMHLKILSEAREGRNN